MIIIFSILFFHTYPLSYRAGNSGVKIYLYSLFRCVVAETLYTLSKREVPRDVRNSKVGDKTSSGEFGLDIRTHASPKVGQDQVSGGVSVLCWHAAPVAYVLWKPCTIR